jgi:hypothetical protein
MTLVDVRSLEGEGVVVISDQVEDLVAEIEEVSAEMIEVVTVVGAEGGRQKCLPQPVLHVARRVRSRSDQIAISQYSVVNVLVRKALMNHEVTHGMNIVMTDLTMQSHVRNNVLQTVLRE